MSHWPLINCQVVCWQAVLVVTIALVQGQVILHGVHGVTALRAGPRGTADSAGGLASMNVARRSRHTDLRHLPSAAGSAAGQLMSMHAQQEPVLIQAMQCIALPLRQRDAKLPSMTSEDMLPVCAAAWVMNTAGGCHDDTADPRQTPRASRMQHGLTLTQS